MTLDYLYDGSTGYRLLRLYDFTPAEAGRLLATVAALRSEAVERVEVHRLPFVAALGNCRLTLVRRAWDQAVVRVGPSAFECGFTAGTWDNVAGLGEPFAAGAAGFQWLAESPGEAALLISVSGEW